LGGHAGAQTIVKIGATSYVFRYLLSDPARAPGIAGLLDLARAAGLERFQICENARPLAVPRAGWREIRRRADDLGLEISLGAMTLDLRVVGEYLERMDEIGGSTLRLVLECEAGGSLSTAGIRGFLDRILPALQSRRARLAIENHFAVPSRLLAEAVEPYPTAVIGFCIDLANSLRNFEDWVAVFDLLESRAFCYHLKDYRVIGSNVGFAVSGAPFGEGVVDRRAVLRRVLAAAPDPEIYLETWTPATGDPETDIAEDARWLARSVENLRATLRVPA
jgi:3-oxoisoapionate decarboxylase